MRRVSNVQNMMFATIVIEALLMQSAHNMHALRTIRHTVDKCPYEWAGITWDHLGALYFIDDTVGTKSGPMHQWFHR
jgi:hypothetical protein